MEKSAVLPTLFEYDAFEKQYLCRMHMILFRLLLLAFFLILAWLASKSGKLVKAGKYYTGSNKLDNVMLRFY